MPFSECYFSWITFDVIELIQFLLKIIFYWQTDNCLLVMIQLELQIVHRIGFVFQLFFVTNFFLYCFLIFLLCVSWKEILVKVAKHLTIGLINITENKWWNDGSDRSNPIRNPRDNWTERFGDAFFIEIVLVLISWVDVSILNLEPSVMTEMVDTEVRSNTQRNKLIG